MVQSSAERLAELAFDLGLLNERQLQEVWASFGRHTVSAEEFLQHLVRRELLTNYQVDRLVKGERTGFFYGDYRVLYLVGSGTFARVFRAAHKATGEVVAVKVLRKRYSENPAQYKLFVREGQFGCALRHENIVAIKEVYSRGKTHFLVMEFVEGRNLREFVKIRKAFQPADALPLMMDIARGLAYAFEHGLTHRDLKMSNVLISSRGQAKLVDFGLAAVDETVHDDGLTDSPNARTIDYAALERATGVRKDDTRSDIYFLGCMYYHMLTGVPPLVETRDRLQRLSKTRFQEVHSIQKVNQNIPSSLAVVVNKAMALEVNRRYQTPGAVLADLEIAARRAGEEPTGEQEPQDEDTEEERLAADMVGLPQQRSVMVVESNTETQNAFRDGLKRAGYRVLVTSDPQRALARIQEDTQVADCVVFGAELLGEAAVEAFNRLGAEEGTRAVPALLLLGENQEAWAQQAAAADHRLVMFMPLTMKQLRGALTRLLAAKSPQ